MSPVNEIDAIASLENILSQLEDPSARDRVIRWAWDKFSSKPLPLENLTAKMDKPFRTMKKVKPPAKTKSGPSIEKGLNLNPEGKLNFRDFVQTKQPSSNQEKCVVAVYYLQRELGITNISVNHVFTCYKNANWKIADLRNILRLTASRKGWVDTSNMDNITITTHGENLIEFDLPRQAKGK